MLDVRKLRVLVAVVESGSIVAAARVVGNSPQALSQQIAALEKEVGGRVLTGPRGRLRPTELGQALVRRARRILAELDGADRDIEMLRRPGVSVLRMAVADLGWSVVPVADELAGSGVALQTHEMQPPLAVGAVTDGQMDCALVYEFPAVALPVRHTWHRFTVAVEPVWVAVPAGHPFATRPEVSLGMLRNESWVSAPEGTYLREAETALFLAAGFTPRVTHSGGADKRTECLRAGGLFALVSPLVADADRYTVLPLADRLVRRVVLAAPPDERHDPLLAPLARAARRSYRTQATASPRYREYLRHNPHTIPDTDPPLDPVPEVMSIAS